MGEPLANDTRQCAVHARHVVGPSLDPVAVAEIELSKVALKVRLGNVLIDCVDTALDDRKEPFGGIRVGIVPHIFLCRVVYSLMLGEPATGPNIHARFIGHKPGVGVDMASDDRGQVGSGHVRDVETANGPVARTSANTDCFGGIRP